MIVWIRSLASSRSRLLFYGKVCSLFPVVILVAILSGCQGEGGLGTSASPPDFTAGLSLQTGDILLARCHGFLPAAFAKFGAKDGLYSHAALYFRDRSGQGMIVNITPSGFFCEPLKSFSRKYYRLAVLRPREPLEEAPMLARIEYWREKDRIRPILPDFTCDPTTEDAMFCLELINVLYEECGRPPPFRETRDVAADPLLRNILMSLHLPVQALPSPNTILQNEAFSVLTQWQSPDYDLRWEVMYETLVQCISDYLREGDKINLPRGGNAFKLRMAFGGISMARFLGSSRQRRMINALFHPDAVRLAFMIRAYIVRVRSEVGLRIRTTLPSEVSALEIARLTRESCHRWRPLYFTMSGSLDCSGPPSLFSSSDPTGDEPSSPFLQSSVGEEDSAGMTRREAIVSSSLERSPSNPDLESSESPGATSPSEGLR